MHSITCHVNDGPWVVLNSSLGVDRAVSVSLGLASLFEQWDGSGRPRGRLNIGYWCY
jgi:hypothetical protein